MKISDRADFAIPLVLFGVPFHNVTFDDTIDWVRERVRQRQPSYIVTANVDFLTQAWGDPELQRILIEADLVVADGMPIVKASSLFGPALKERVTGSDLTPMLGKTAVADGMSIYCFGGADEVPQAAADELVRRNPGLKIAGAYSPPYAPLLEMDHAGLRDRINQAAPDLLLVAFGAPKQEKFINMHFRDWNVPVAIGIGATLDFLAGAQRRAPVLVQKLWLEWLWRMLSDPKRLVQRYFSNFKFLFLAFAKLGRARLVPRHAAVVDDPDIAKRWPHRLIEVSCFTPVETTEAAQAILRKFKGVTSRSSLVLDFRGMSWLNSVEQGVLLELSKRCRRYQNELFLYGVGRRMDALLKGSRLDQYLFISNSAVEIEHRIGELKKTRLNSAVTFSDGCLCLNMPSELTAGMLQAYRVQFETVWAEVESSKGLVFAKVECQAMDFIDSSGIGFFMELCKRCRLLNTAVSFEHIQPIPMKVFKVARVDRIFKEQACGAGSGV